MADDNTITQPRNRYLAEVADPPPDGRHSLGGNFRRTFTAAEFVGGEKGGGNG